MSVNQEPCFNDKERITDALSSQKFVTSLYNATLLEAATPEVKSCLSGILEDEHHIAEELFYEMQSRGWYKTEQADDNKVMQLKQTFGTNVTV